MKFFSNGLKMLTCLSILTLAGCSGNTHPKGSYTSFSKMEAGYVDGDKVVKADIPGYYCISPVYDNLLCYSLLDNTTYFDPFSVIGEDGLKTIYLTSTWKTGTIIKGYPKVAWSTSSYQEVPEISEIWFYYGDGDLHSLADSGSFTEIQSEAVKLYDADDTDTTQLTGIINHPGKTISFDKENYPIQIQK